MDHLREQVHEHDSALDRLTAQLGRLETELRRLRELELAHATMQAEAAHVKAQMAEVRAGQQDLQKTVWRAGGLVSAIAIVTALVDKLL